MVAGLPRDNGEIVHDDIQQKFFLLSSGWQAVKNESIIEKYNTVKI